MFIVTELSKVRQAKNGANLRYESLANSLKSAGFKCTTLNLEPSSAARPWRFKSYKQPFISMYKEQNPDLVVFQGISLAPLIPYVQKSQILLDVCDSLIESVTRNSKLSKFSLLLRFLALFSLWRSALGANYITYITLEDLQKDRHLWQKSKCFIVPNLQSHELQELEPISDSKKLIGYVADWNYAPNLHGLNWFLKNVFPTISKRGWKLCLFGINPPTTKLPPRVEVSEYLPNLQDVYSSFNVAVCIDFIGSGFKNKVSEAILSARPVITTSIGARGQKRNSGLFISDSSEEIIQCFSTFEKDNFLPEISKQMRLETSLQANSDESPFYFLGSEKA